MVSAARSVGVVRPALGRSVVLQVVAYAPAVGQAFPYGSVEVEAVERNVT